MLIMERPKSAKHNIERYKKSAYANYKRNLLNNAANNNNNNNNQNQRSYLNQSTTPTSLYTTDTNPNINSTTTSYYFNNFSNAADLSFSSSNRTENFHNLMINGGDQSRLNNESPISHQQSQLIIDDYNNTSSLILSNNGHRQIQKEQRILATKSAMVSGSLAKLRPQSARHNLEKYRKDVLIEQQKKLQIKILNQQLKQQQQQVANNNNGNENVNENSIVIEQIDPNPTEKVNPNVPVPNDDDDDDDDDIDNLDGLLIREEDSSSDLESANTESMMRLTSLANNSNLKLNKHRIKLASLNTNNNNNTNGITNGLVNDGSFTLGNNRKQKLLNRRNTGAISNNNNNNNIINSNNNNNQTGNLTTSNTSTNNLISNSYSSNTKEILNLLPNKSEKVNIYTTFRPTAVTTTYSTSPPNLNTQISTSSLSNNNNDEKNGAEIQTQTNPVVIKSIIKNKLNSSSTTNTSHQQQQQQYAQLVSESINGPRSNSVMKFNESVTRDEWINEDGIVKNGEIVNKKIQFQQHVQRIPTSSQKSEPIGHVAPIEGRTSKFSDYSFDSNQHPNHPNTNHTVYINREKSSLIDPWAKRNPTLVAQNVLLKHHAELEQIAASRNTNNSQNSNISNLLTATNTLNNANSKLSTNNAKFLLPDTKYFKK